MKPAPSETTRPAGSADGRDGLRSTWLDFVAPAAGVLALVVSARLSVGQRRFWTDEWLTWYLVADESFAHMLAACGDLINAAPPLYFIAGWLWTRVFGAGELSLRLLTSLGFSCGLVTLWWAIRRAWGSWPAATAVLVSVLGCVELQRHNAQARFYGMYFAEIAAALAILVAMARRPRPARGLLLASTLVHAALVTTHYFGFVYSAAILIATTLHFARRPSAALLAAGSIALGWLAFLPWIPAFLHHREFGGAGFWVPRPHLGSLLAAFDLVQWPGLAVLLVGTPAVLVEALRRGRAGPIAPAPLPDASTAECRRALALAALAFALVPLATWAASKRGTSLFLGRYMFPTTIAFAVLLAHATAGILERARLAADGAPPPRTLILRAGPKSVFAVLVAVYVFAPPALLASQPRAPASVDGLTAPSGEPIVVEDLHDFFAMYRYSRFPESYVYVLDPEFVRSRRDVPRSANAYQIMETLARHYDVPAVPVAELLARHERFLVFDSPEMLWFDIRIRNDASFECRLAGDDPRWWLVTRKREG